MNIWMERKISLTGDSKMNGLMERNADLWTICLSHTLGCAVDGMKAKSTIFGIEKNKFDQSEFLKEVRKPKKIPKSAGKGKNLNQKQTISHLFQYAAKHQNKVYFRFFKNCRRPKQCIFSLIYLKELPMIKTKHFDTILLSFAANNKNEHF